jgi:hypothetical protein
MQSVKMFSGFGDARHHEERMMNEQSQHRESDA